MTCMNEYILATVRVSRMSEIGLVQGEPVAKSLKKFCKN